MRRTLYEGNRQRLKLGVYTYIIYTPNLGLEIAVPGREREQGRFRGSSEGARESNGGATGGQTTSQVKVSPEFSPVLSCRANPR